MVSGGGEGAQNFYFLHDLCLRDCKSQLTYVDVISTCLLPALSMTGMGPVARKLPTYLSRRVLFATGASGNFRSNIYGNSGSKCIQSILTATAQLMDSTKTAWWPLRTDWLTDWRYLLIKMTSPYFDIGQTRRPKWAKHVYRKLCINLHLNSNGSLLFAWHTELFSNNLTHTCC
jgi:hypothetical protein